MGTQQLIPLPCERLETGMYVEELDRSWLHTPFNGPGLLLSSEEQISTAAPLLPVCVHQPFAQ
ncbi:MAG TPA: DUF3391 domain-containing protein [Chromatiales bacterium]|nr:DUF3391 domain-containing protein [Chromatiales bacterium]